MGKIEVEFHRVKVSLGGMTEPEDIEKPIFRVLLAAARNPPDMNALMEELEGALTF